MNITEPKKVKIKDYSSQPYEEDDEEDFEVKTINEDKLIDDVPVFDDEREFEDDMNNYGDQDDLPDSDRIMDCRSRNISHKVCMNK